MMGKKWPAGSWKSSKYLVMVSTVIPHQLKPNAGVLRIKAGRHLEQWCSSSHLVLLPLWAAPNLPHGHESGAARSTENRTAIVTSDLPLTMLEESMRGRVPIQPFTQMLIHPRHINLLYQHPRRAVTHSFPHSGQHLQAAYPGCWVVVLSATRYITPRPRSRWHSPCGASSPRRGIKT